MLCHDQIALLLHDCSIVSKTTWFEPLGYGDMVDHNSDNKLSTCLERMAHLDLYVAKLGLKSILPKPLPWSTNENN